MHDDIKNDLKEFYQSSDNYNALLNHRTNPRQVEVLSDYADCVKDWVSKNDNFILDIGCGTGYSSLLISSLCSVPSSGLRAKGQGQRVKGSSHSALCSLHVVGLDISTKFLSSLGEKSNDLILMTGDIFCLPFKDNSMNIITSHETIEHLPDVPSALSEMKRVVKPGGKIIIISPNLLSPITYLEHKLSHDNGDSIPYIVKGTLNNLILYTLKLLHIRAGPIYIDPRLDDFKGSDDDAVYLSSPMDIKRWMRKNNFKLLRNKGFPKNPLGKFLCRFAPSLYFGMYIVGEKR